MTSYRDWVVETSSTTGTGAYNLSGAAPAGTSYFTFRQRYSNGEDEVSYWVVSADRTKWEKNRFCTLTYGTPDTLTRNVVESTNGDAAVSWVGGDAPLRLYVVPDADAEEFAISMGLGAARPDVLKFGLWADEDDTASNYDTLKFFDGTSDDNVGVINKVAHRATIYGLPSGYLYGLTLSRSSATALGIAAGIAMDSTNVVGIKLASAFTKSTAGAWTVGTGQNGMGNSLTIANNTWYHVFAILNAGVADAYFDTSVSAANKPAGTTYFRRIGSFKTDGSAQIIAFTQTGDLFQWSTEVTDGSAITTTGLKTVTVPTGVAVNWQGRVNLSAGATVVGLEILTPGVTPHASSLLIIAGTSVGAAVPYSCLTNTSAQINDAQHLNAASYSLFTTGWLDRRGQDG
jgi:hypothetical protein